MSTGIDRRRRTGPSNATPLYFPPCEITEKKSIVTDNKLFAQLSNIPTATGSSFIQSGNNILLASVYGPRPSFKKAFNSKAVVKITFHSSPFLLTRQSMNNFSLNKVSENIVVDPEYLISDSIILSTLETACNNLIILDNYPKSSIDIFVNLINTDNKTKFIELLPLIHNAVNLALVDSGIAIKNFPAAAVSSKNIFVNSIHSSTYSSNNDDDLNNEDLLTFYIPKYEDNNNNNDNDGIYEDDLLISFKEAIKTAKELRSELSQLCIDQL